MAERKSSFEGVYVGDASEGFMWSMYHGPSWSATPPLTE